MSEKINGTHFHTWLDEHFDRPFYDKYDKHEKKEPRIIDRVVENLKGKTSEDICITDEHKRELGPNINRSADGVLQKTTIASIMGLAENSLKLMLLRRGAIGELVQNGKNLAKNRMLGENFMTNHAIRLATEDIKKEMESGIILTRGDCDKCLNTYCPKRIKKEK